MTAQRSAIPLIATEPIPTPTEAQSNAPTQTEMRNVDFHVDEATILKIHQLRGEMISKQAGTPLVVGKRFTTLAGFGVGAYFTIPVPG